MSNRSFYQQSGAMISNRTINISIKETIFNESQYCDNIETIPGFLYTIIAVFLLMIMLIGIVLNGGIIYVFFVKKGLGSNSSIYVVALCICGLILSVLGIPFTFVSSLVQEWKFGRIGCQFNGFIFTGMGITMIAILTVIAIDKYIVIVKFNTRHKITKKTANYAVLACYIYGCSWATYPLVGWNEFKLEIAQLSCSIKWESRYANHISYSICLVIAGLLAPVTIILYLYVGILRTVRRQRNISCLMRHSSRSKKSMKRENRVAKTVLIMIGAFVVSWLPYSIFSIIAILGYSSYVPLTLRTIPSMFAKGSVLSNPIIYVGRNRCMKRALIETYPWLKYIFLRKSRQHRTLVSETSQNRYIECSGYQGKRAGNVITLDESSEKLVSSTMV